MDFKIWNQIMEYGILSCDAIVWSLREVEFQIGIGYFLEVGMWNTWRR